MPLAALATIQGGGYISPWKTLVIVVILFLWVRLLTWIDKDSTVARLPRELMNLLMFVPLVGGFLLFFILPGFQFALTVLIFLFLADLGTYLGLRAKSVGLGDLTTVFKDKWTAITTKKTPDEIPTVAGQVQLYTLSGVPQHPPDGGEELQRYQSAQALLTVPLQYGAERVDLAAGDPATLGYIVDGVIYETDPLPYENANGATLYLKTVAGLDPDERRKPQTGRFRATLDGGRHTIQVTSFGSNVGESLRLLIDPQSRANLKVDGLGFTPEQLDIVKQGMMDPGGVILLAAPKGHGLTSLAYGAIRMHDAFLYHVHTVERAPDMELEGITQNVLPLTPGPGEEAKKVSWVVDQDPDVIMLTLMEEPQSAVELAKWAADTKRAYIGIRASNTFDAIRQWRRQVGDDALAMRNLRMVIAGRLVRRLCTACKVGYQPDPNQLRKLNMDPNTVGNLYLARKEPMRDSKGRIVPCPFCHDLGFKGRFGVYEIFVVDDEVRDAVINNLGDNQLKQLFRKQQGRLLQETALHVVQEGETSVEEVLRVLRNDSQQPPPAGSAGKSAATRPGGPGGTGGPGASGSAGVSHSAGSQSPRGGSRSGGTDSF
jgi:type II secretory ATPase GspE/PulE/Tfp pilus assembly ATPase PilB-like protein